jgi:hypothetical protein
VLQLLQGLRCGESAEEHAYGWSQRSGGDTEWMMGVLGAKAPSSATTIWCCDARAEMRFLGFWGRSGAVEGVERSTLMQSTCKPQGGSERLQMSDTPGILESPKSPMCTSKGRGSAAQKTSARGCGGDVRRLGGRQKQVHATAAETRGGRYGSSWLWERSVFGLRSRRREQDKCQFTQGDVWLESRQAQRTRDEAVFTALCMLQMAVRQGNLFL